MESKSIKTLTGIEPGKSVVIMAGVHGDETCGIAAFETILPSLTLKRGSATFIYGNPEAIAAGKRFTEANLNRMFRAENDLGEPERASYEFRRSREILPYLRECDALLDIHSSGTVDSIPFLICEPHSFGVATRLPVSVVSSGWDVIQPGGTDSFVNESGGMGICIECGYHNDPAAVNRACTAIYEFLASLNLIDQPQEVRKATEKTFMEVTYLYKTQQNFEPARLFKDFEPIKKGELIGKDGGIDIQAPYNGYALFVRTRSNPNEEAFLVAQDIKKTA